MHVSRLIGVLLLAAAASGVAQDTPTRLALDDAIAIARRQNPAFQRALNTRNASGAAVRAQWGNLLPSITGSLETGATRSTRSIGEGDFGEVVEQPKRSFTTSGSSQGVSANFTLFDGLQNVNSLRAARADADAARSAVSAEENRLVASVSTAFYDALRRERLIAVEAQLLDAAREQLAVTERFLAVARTDQVDVLGARVEVARAEQRLALAEATAQQALLDLTVAMGLDNGQTFRLADERPQVFDPSVLVPDALIAQAFRANPDVAQLDAEVAAAAHRASAAKGAWLPSITASGRFNRNVNGDALGSLFDVNPTDNRSVGFSISASLPIFDGFQRAQQVAASNESLRNAEETRRERRLEIERDVRAALIDLENRHRSLEIARQSAALANERVTLSRDQFQLGAIEFTELQQIVEQSAQEQRGLVNAEFDFVNALVELERTVGERVPS